MCNLRSLSESPGFDPLRVHSPPTIFPLLKCNSNIYLSFKVVIAKELGSSHPVWILFSSSKITRCTEDKTPRTRCCVFLLKEFNNLPSSSFPRPPPATRIAGLQKNQLPHIFRNIWDGISYSRELLGEGRYCNSIL